MRTLLLFFVRYYAFFLFLLLEIFSVYLLVLNKSFHSAAYFSSANYVAGTFYQTKNNLAEYLNLKNINDRLASENARLKDELQYNSVNENKADSFFQNGNQRQFFYIPAKVINNTINQANNYLTLDKGKNAGINSQMGVVCSNGIVGIIKDVSANFSSVISLLHRDFKVSAKIKKNGYFGGLAWNGLDPHSAQLTEIPKHAGVTKGDTVVTSGYSTFFPENILIGTVESVELREGDNFYKIKVSISTDFQHLDYVYVVNNPSAVEQNDLEEASRK